MDILEKNLQSYIQLKDYYEKFKDQLYQIEYAKNGELTIKLNNIYLHSKYDPLKEAQRIVEMLTIDKEILDIIIIFGSGLGYVARMLFEKFIINSSSKILPYIIYIEKDLKLFLTSLKYFNWSEILQNNNFKSFLDVEKEVIGSFIQSIPTKRIRYYYHRPSYIINQEYYKTVQNYLSYVLDRKDMNTATFCNFQKLWTKNFIYNLPEILKTKAVKKLINIGKDTTSIVIAAGPTLERSINYIKSLKEKVIIIAVDTVYKYLKKNSIIPDFIVTIDPQYWNFKYLENEKIEKTMIITHSDVYHKILTIADINNFFSGSSIFPIVKYFDENNEARGSLSAGGSVATTAFDVARIIGSKNIILLGLDLSFPGRMTHFKGAFFESNFIKESDYYNSPDMASYKYLAHVNMSLIDSTNNEKVFTDQKMFLFKKWFDREIPLTDANVYIPNFGGALLEGAKIISAEDLLNISKTGKETFLINKTKLLNEKVDSFDPINMNKKIDLIIQRSNDIKIICRKIIKLIPDDGFVKPDDQKTINKLEQSLFENPEIEEAVRVISSSAQDILLSIMENIEYNRDEKISAWLKTKKLYESIENLSNFYSKCLKKTLKLFKNFSE